MGNERRLFLLGRSLLSQPMLLFFLPKVQNLPYQADRHNDLLPGHGSIVFLQLVVLII